MFISDMEKTSCSTSTVFIYENYKRANAVYGKAKSITEKKETVLHFLLVV